MKKTLLAMTILLTLIAIGGLGFAFKNNLSAYFGAPPWPPDLDPVLIYNADFAHRFGLDPSKAQPLDPGVFAIAMTFDKHYEYDLEPSKGDNPDQFSHKGNGDQLTMDERSVLDTHAGILPILFPGRYNSYGVGESYTRHTCAINLYLDNNNPQIQQIDFRPASVFVWRLMYYTLINDLWHGHFDESRPGQPSVDSLKMNRLHPAMYGMDILSNLKKWAWTQPGQSHYVNFLPGITFVTFEIDCDMPKYFPHGMWIWFEKKGGTNYFHQQDDKTDPDLGNPNFSLDINPDDFVAFHIPAQITNSPNVRITTKNIIIEEEHSL